MLESWYVRLTYRRNHQRDRRLRLSANGVKTNRRLAMEKKDSLKDGPISCSSKISFILFLADNDPTTGQSWCPDCVRVEHVIYKTLEEFPEEENLIPAYAGDIPA
ncbi:unnamed protein product [Arabidopsis lyrata]|nr:unnamed protein product [Arabidopsis lyrata]